MDGWAGGWKISSRLARDGRERLSYEVGELLPVNDWQHRTLKDYQEKGFAARSGYGDHPALLIVDFMYAFTDPSTPLGGDFFGSDRGDPATPHGISPGRFSRGLHHYLLRAPL